MTRQFVYLRPDLLVVFGRVDALDPSFEKRFLRRRSAARRRRSSTAKAKLVSQTLLPSAANVTLNASKQAQRRGYFLHLLQLTDASDAAPPTAQVTQDPQNARTRAAPTL